MWLKYTYFGGYVGMVVSIIVGAALEAALGTGLFLGLGGLVGLVCGIAWVLSIIAWSYQAWASVPPIYRRAEPWAAAVLCVIPCLSTLYSFAGNAMLVTALNTSVAVQGGGRRVHLVFPMIAAVLQLMLSFGQTSDGLFSCAGAMAPVFWFIFMYQADNARAQLADHDDFDANEVADVFR